MATTAFTVDSIISQIKKSKDTTQVENSKEIKPSAGNSKKSEDITIRGQPKSGRFWKTEKERFSSINKVKGLKLNLEKRTARRDEIKRIKEVSRLSMEKKIQEAEAKKERRRANLKRNEENRKKSDIVQVITNSVKLKKMKKKTLRYIEKRDTTIISKLH